MILNNGTKLNPSAIGLNISANTDYFNFDNQKLSLCELEMDIQNNKKCLSFIWIVLDEPENSRLLVKYFIKSVKKGQLLHIPYTNNSTNISLKRNEMTPFSNQKTIL